MTDPMQTEREADLPICPECNGSGKDGTPDGFSCFPCNGTGKNLGVDHAPVAFAVFAPNGNIRLWSTDGEYVRRFAESHGVQATPLYRKASDDQTASELRSLRDALALARSHIGELREALESIQEITREEHFIRSADSKLYEIGTYARAALKEDSE